jgi:DNA replication regulator SLD3
MLLPRVHLPLSCLDLAAPLGEFEYARFYESNVKILDLESRMGSRPVVLIARLETNKTVFALERQDNGLYTLCKLGNWVNLEKISSCATVAYSKLIKPRPKISLEDGRPVPLETPQLHKENKKRRLAIEAIQSLVKRPTRSPSISQASQGAETTRPPTPVQAGPALPDASNVLTPAAIEAPSPSITPVPDETSPPTANDIFDNVRNQYLEALYHSMVSRPSNLCETLG